MKTVSAVSLYSAMRWIVGLALGFYFRRIERFHSERVPTAGPVLFTSNHPNSLTDSFVIGASVPRKVNFVATVQLFRFRPLKWFLIHCGVIPINRVKDDPKAMRSVADTFEACFRVLEAGEAVGIFPEGVTYDDAQLKEVKTGAARMALELEHRHEGKLGLKIVPVGLTYSAKELYRSDVLTNIGQPILVANYLDGYTERRKECILRLTEEIASQLRALIEDLPELEYSRIVEAIKRLYLDDLRLGNNIVHEAVSSRAEELLLTQRIIQAVQRIFETEPQRALAFVGKLDAYNRYLKRLRISDEPLKLFPDKGRLLARNVVWTLMAVLGAPLALYGWLHRLLPFAVVRWAVHRFTEPAKRKAQASTAVIATGIVTFGTCYVIFIVIFHRFFGWPASFWYALSLPVASLLAHYYLRELKRLIASMRTTAVLLRAPTVARHLLTLRSALVEEIESVAAGVSPHRQRGSLGENDRTEWQKS